MKGILKQLKGHAPAVLIVGLIVGYVLYQHFHVREGLTVTGTLRDDGKIMTVLNGQFVSCSDFPITVPPSLPGLPPYNGYTDAILVDNKLRKIVFNPLARPVTKSVTTKCNVPGLAGPDITSAEMMMELQESMRERNRLASMPQVLSIGSKTLKDKEFVRCTNTTPVTYSIVDGGKLRRLDFFLGDVERETMTEVDCSLATFGPPITSPMDLDKIRPQVPSVGPANSLIQRNPIGSANSPQVPSIGSPNLPQVPSVGTPTTTDGVQTAKNAWTKWYEDAKNAWTKWVDDKKAAAEKDAAMMKSAAEKEAADVKAAAEKNATAVKVAAATAKTNADRDVAAAKLLAESTKAKVDKDTAALKAQMTEFEDTTKKSQDEIDAAKKSLAAQQDTLQKGIIIAASLVGVVLIGGVVYTMMTRSSSTPTTGAGRRRR